MALIRTTAALLLAACVPDGPVLVRTTVALGAEEIRPPGGASSITLTSAVVSVADLALLDGDGRVGGAWAGLRRVDLLAEPTSLGVIEIYAGDYAASRFTVGGTPTLSLVGEVARLDGQTVPFELELTGVLPLAGIATDVVVTDQESVSPLVWTLSLTRAVNRVDWTTERPDGEPLTAAQGLVGPQLREGITDPDAWTLGQDRPDTGSP